MIRERLSASAHLIVRTGEKLQLCGRSETLNPRNEGRLPQGVWEIVRDAILAQSEKDTAAAYYHLRTAIEHHMKAALGKEIEAQIEGQSIGDDYKKTLPIEARDLAPSFNEIYAKLSAGMHSRHVSSNEFEQLLEQVFDHFELVRLHNKLRSR